MTQKQLAELMNLSDKTISKWERGLGLPDISSLTELSEILGVNIEEILKGNLSKNAYQGGNMKKSNYYVCPNCENLTISTGNAQVSCCGRKLEVLKVKVAKEEQLLEIGQFENNWRITSHHPMKKNDYISFVALVNDSELNVIKQYPEWALAVEFSADKRGMLMWYSKEEGLLTQKLK